MASHGCAQGHAESTFCHAEVTFDGQRLLVFWMWTQVEGDLLVPFLIGSALLVGLNLPHGNRRLDGFNCLHAGHNQIAELARSA